MPQCEYKLKDWQCPHETHGAKNHCIFHLPVEEKDPAEFWKHLANYLLALYEKAGNDETAKFAAKRERWMFSELDNELRHHFGTKVSPGQTWSFTGYKFPPAEDERRSFRRFTFGPVDFSGAQFVGAALFRAARFSGDARFADTEFAEVADFTAAEFGADAVFLNPRFGGVAHFPHARFEGNAFFRNARFVGNANFPETRFNGDARFGDTQFGGDARFRDVLFAGQAGFERARFNGDAVFERARFGGNARFDHTHYAKMARFGETKFGGHADFRYASVSGNSDFSHSRFDGSAGFPCALFQGEMNFTTASVGGNAGFWGARFNGRTTFRHTRFGKNTRFTKAFFGAGATFSGVNFEGVADFSFARFIKPPSFGSALFEKRLDFFEAQVPGLAGHDDERTARDMRHVAEEHGSYADAGDFYTIEMDRRLKRFRKTPERWFQYVLMELYRVFSKYGESPGRGLLSILGLVGISGYVYLFTGFKFATRAEPIHRHFRFDNSQFEPTLRDFGLAVLYAFTNLVPGWFRMEGTRPASTCTAIIAIVQTILGIVILALFLLAVRRRFRR